MLELLSLGGFVLIFRRKRQNWIREGNEMSITLELPDELTNELSAEADQYGVPLPEYLIRLLSTIFVTDKKPKTGVELVEYWQSEGLIGTRSDIADSQTHARQIRQQAQSRTRA
jgi:hypothetical protein